MKLYNGEIIIAGIVVFLIAATFPFWYGRGKAVPPPELKLDTPAIERLTEKRCVETTRVHAGQPYETPRRLAGRRRPGGNPVLHGRRTGGSSKSA